MTQDSSPSIGRVTGRAKGEIERARDIRFGTWQALAAGLALAVAGIALKAALNAFFGGETGDIVLVAIVIVAAWFGGLVGGIVATIVALGLNAILFLGPASGVDPRIAQVRELVYLLTGFGTAVLVATRRASRDRLANALAEVASLAEEVETRDDRLELMLAASGTGFWEWDMVTGELTWSEAIFRQHGLPMSPVAPDFPTYLETIHPDDREPFQAAIQAAVEEGVPLDLDFRILWPDGSVHWTHGSGRVFRDESGAPIRMLGTGQDITERRRTADERDQLLVEERRAREFRDAFIDVISHELRTPITTILGLTQILARPGRTDDQATRAAMLEDVRAESERLHRLTEDLLVLSRVERGRLQVDSEPLELRRLLEGVVTAEREELPGLAIATAIDADLPVVAGEATYVEQIVRNMLGNAAKYTPPGTSVTVAARREDSMVEVRIIDDGPGIPQESIDRIFQLFYRDPTSARTVAGSGIGLFVCASLVEAMGGRIWCVRRPEGGSEFGFTLRALDADVDEVGPDTAILDSPLPDAPVVDAPLVDAPLADASLADPPLADASLADAPIAADAQPAGG